LSVLTDSGTEFTAAELVEAGFDKLSRRTLSRRMLSRRKFCDFA